MRALLFLALLSVLGASAAAHTFTADSAASQLRFRIGHMRVSSVHGRFCSFTATITSVRNDFSDAVFELRAASASIDTRNGARDRHLRGADFFDVATYPIIVFRSTSLVPDSGGSFLLLGDLSMHGVTRSVRLQARITRPPQDTASPERITVEVSGTLSRLDFGIGKRYGRGSIGDEVRIRASGTFVRD